MQIRFETDEIDLYTIASFHHLENMTSKDACDINKTGIYNILFAIYAHHASRVSGRNKLCAKTKFMNIQEKSFFSLFISSETLDDLGGDGQETRK